MDPIHINDVIKAVRGQLVQGSSNIGINGVSIDSRTIKPGDLFLAFPGERVDGHDFLEQVFDQGAAAAVISHPVNFQRRITIASYITFRWLQLPEAPEKPQLRI
jgi:UDP-N-acetylmuramoyl-tripeptide--D-alanyl-D-alanine ligase